MPAPYFRDTTGIYTGLGRKLTKAEGDGNTYNWHTRLLAVEAALSSGVSITGITPGAASFTIHLSDGSSEVIGLPIATFDERGEWLNSTLYFQNDVVSKRGVGYFLVRETHTTPALPAAFDPAATDSTTAHNPLYLKIGLSVDVDYDIAFSLPGSQERTIPTSGVILAQIILDRTIEMASGLSGAYAYLDTPTAGAGTDPTALEISIDKNNASIGTITFATGANFGTITFASTVDFAPGDRLALIATRADDAAASDLSVTLPAVRTDI